MKTIHRIVFKMIMAVAFFALIMISCDDMNSLHEKYLDRGIDIYIGSADSLSVQPGLHRIRFKWKINADPRIEKTVISWEEIEAGAMVGRSIELPVIRTTEGEMWLEHILYDLPEGEYVFKFQIFDDSGNTSKVREISGLVLGDIYVENLRNRNIKLLSKLETGDMQINWETAPSGVGLLYSVVEYINRDGETIKVEVPNSEDRTLLEGLETGDEVKVYAVYLPENGLENFQSIARLFIMPKFERLLDKDRFVAAFKPGDNTTPHPGSGADDWMKPITDFGVGQRSLAKIWDGGAVNNSNNRTILHTEDQSGNANSRFKFPHHFTFDMGTDAALSTFKIWSRADNGAFTGHSPRFFELWATDVPKQLEDFADQATFEQYYRTTYVVQKNPANYVSSNDPLYTDKLTNANAQCVNNNFLAPEPEPGIYNWQQDWVKLGDFEIEKPSGLNYNSSNDADKALWGSGSTNSPEALESCGFSFSLPESTKRYRYIRLVIKFPNWQNSNCINLGEISIYGDDI